MTQTILEGSTMRLEPAGDLVSKGAKDMSDEWREALERSEGIKRVEVDMTNVTFIDSSGIGLLVGMYKECTTIRRLEFGLTNCNDFVKNLLKTVKLDDVFKIS